jgi:hypothetical protein
MNAVSGTGPVLQGVGKEGIHEACPLSLCCQEGLEDRGSPKWRATSLQAYLGEANAEHMCHFRGGQGDVSMPAALGHLHVEADGGGEVAERVEGCDRCQARPCR